MCPTSGRWTPASRLIRVEDKQRIGNFLAGAPGHLRHLGNVDWIDLNRGDSEYFELGCKKIGRVLGVYRAPQMRRKTGTDRPTDPRLGRRPRPG